MLPLFASLLAVGVLAAPLVAVEGTLDCPSPARVSEEFERIVPSLDLVPGGDRALVVSDSGVLLVLLRGADGAVLGERRVAADGNCDDQARAVAVILAAWITDVHPEYRSALPAAETAGVSAKSEQDASSMPVAPPPAPPVTQPVAALPFEPPRRRVKAATASAGVERRWSAAGAFGAEISDAGIVPVAEVSASYAPDRAGLGVTALLLVAAPADRTLGAGQVSAFRWPLGVGALFRVPAGRAFVDLSAGPTIGWVHLEGDDFATNRGADDAAAGGFARVRVGAHWPMLRPFLEAGVLGWFGSTTVLARQPNAEVELPALETFIAGGISFEP